MPTASYKPIVKWAVRLAIIGAILAAVGFATGPAGKGASFLQFVGFVLSRTAVCALGGVGLAAGRRVGVANFRRVVLKQSGGGGSPDGNHQGRAIQQPNN